MPTIKLKTQRTGRVLFEGPYADTRACLEAAVAEGTCLDNVDLTQANLVNANLDDAVMRGACLNGANLMGANLSEARLDDSFFINAYMHSTCLAFSSLTNCDFRGALFGGTDIAGSDITDCHFSTQSALTLPFREVEKLSGCVFHWDDALECPMTHPPVVINGLPLDIVFMDTHIKIGTDVKTYADWVSYTRKQNTPALTGNSMVSNFVKQHQTLIDSLCKTKTKEI